MTADDQVAALAEAMYQSPDLDRAARVTLTNLHAAGWTLARSEGREALVAVLGREPWVRVHYTDRPPCFWCRGHYPTHAESCRWVKARAALAAPAASPEACAREGCGRSLADHYTAEPFAIDCTGYQPATASAAATSDLHDRRRHAVYVAEHGSCGGTHLMGYGACQTDEYRAEYAARLAATSEEGGRG